MCDSCNGLSVALEDAYREEARLHEQIAELQAKVEALQKEFTVKAMQLGKARAAQEREHGESAEARTVIEVIEFWAMTTGHTRAKVSAAGARGDAVRKAIRLGHSVDELKEAIEGAALFPFVVNKQRSKTGKESQRYDDLPTVFRDEVQIQRMRKLAGTHPDAQTGTPSDQPLSAQESWRQLHYPLAVVLAALRDQNRPMERPTEDVWRTDCPVHFGPALTARRNPDGTMFLECERGCEFWRLLAALGLQPGDLFENAEQDPSRAQDAPRAVPAHLQEAAGLLQVHLAALAGKSNGV